MPVAIAGMCSLCLMVSCASPLAKGRVRAISKAENPVQIDLDLEHGSYSIQPSEISFYLSDCSLESLQQGELRNATVLHAQLLWSPKPGSTPVDPTATNVTLRLALVVEGELGIYGGAGFAWPDGEAGDGPMSLEIVGSTMTLLHATEGFRDLLSPVMLLGSISAPFDPVKTLRSRQAASQLVTDLLGRTQWVMRDVTSFEERVALRADP